MDPNAAWQQFLDVCEENDHEAAIAKLDDLLGWYASGGFPASGVSRTTLINLRDWLECAINWMRDECDTAH
jgi:hypothetical protein